MIPAEWTYLQHLFIKVKLRCNKKRIVLHATDDLVDEELDVVVGKLLGLDDVVQVGPHQVGDLRVRSLIL